MFRLWTSVGKFRESHADCLRVMDFSTRKEAELALAELEAEVRESQDVFLSDAEISEV